MSIGRPESPSNEPVAMPSAGALPTISVVTVVYNGAAVIGRTLASVAEQRGEHIEYIVVDGGSTDGTMEQVRDSGLRVDRLISERDHGIYDAMNKGARLARGEYLYFLNAGDTFCAPDVLQRAAELLMHRPALLAGQVVVDAAAGVRYPVRLTDSALRDARVLFATHFCHQALFVSRTDLLATGGFDLRYPHFADFHSAWRVMQCGAVECVDGFDIAFFPLDGVSSDWRRAVDFFNEREGMLEALGFGGGVLARLFGRIRAHMYLWKMSVRSR
jgi:glycosyltransferase involved in cell wall biosynthesis